MALAAAPFLVSSSNLIQSAYAKVDGTKDETKKVDGTKPEKKAEGQDYEYCFDYTTPDGGSGWQCIYHEDENTAKKTCESGREGFLAATLMLLFQSAIWIIN